ncbi:hypothetical protein EV426DRAFT_577262 [Tirmania nivea]|nr:hypothetical protein EV426DRAFT_577262 [Tirmania nivea]
MYKMVKFFRGTDWLNLPALNTTPSGEDGTSAPPSTPVEGPILPEEKGKGEGGGGQEKEGGEDEVGEEEEDEEVIWDTTSTYSMEDGDFIRLTHHNPPFYEPSGAQFFCRSDLESLINRYQDIHVLPDPYDERFEHMLNYLGWHMPSNELVADSLKWVLIMKIRASLENELMTELGFHDIHHVSNSDNPGEYVAHAIYRGLIPENLPPYYFRIKYVCMYFGSWNSEHLGICECDDMYTRMFGSAAEEDAHTEFETEGKAECVSENEESKAQVDAEPEAKPTFFSDPAGEEKISRVTGQTLDLAQQEPQQQENKQAKTQQEEEQQGQPQRPQEQQEPHQCQQYRQILKVPELLQSRQAELFRRLEVSPVPCQQEGVQLPPQQTQRRAQQQHLKQEQTQQPAQPQAKAQAQSSQPLAQAQACAHVPQECQSPQLPAQAQTSPGATPFLLPFPPPPSPTQWSTAVFNAWNTLQHQALKVREEARRCEQQVRQLSANNRVRAGEGFVSPTAAPSTPTGYWAPAPTVTLGPPLPLLASQAQQQQTTPNGQYGRPLNQASSEAMCDPSVTPGLLRERPNIGDMDKYLENRPKSKKVDFRPYLKGKSNYPGATQY